MSLSYSPFVYFPRSPGPASGLQVLSRLGGFSSQRAYDALGRLTRQRTAPRPRDAGQARTGPGHAHPDPPRDRHIDYRPTEKGIKYFHQAEMTVLKK